MFDVFATADQVTEAMTAAGLTAVVVSRSSTVAGRSAYINVSGFGARTSVRVSDHCVGTTRLMEHVHFNEQDKVESFVADLVASLADSGRRFALEAAAEAAYELSRVTRQIAKLTADMASTNAKGRQKIKFEIKSLFAKIAA